MAVVVKCSDPAKLIRKIRELIEDGSIKTWSIDSDGDLTHSPDQWANKAWMRPKKYVDEVIFGIVPTKTGSITVTLYAVYHGRFIEMLLRHFDGLFDEAHATAQPLKEDTLKGSHFSK